MQHVMQRLYHRQVVLQHGYELSWLPEAVLAVVLVHLRHQQHQFHILVQLHPQQN